MNKNYFKTILEQPKSTYGWLDKFFVGDATLARWQTSKFFKAFFTENLLLCKRKYKRRKYFFYYKESMCQDVMCWVRKSWKCVTFISFIFTKQIIKHVAIAVYLTWMNGSQQMPKVLRILSSCRQHMISPVGLFNMKNECK